MLLVKHYNYISPYNNGQEEVHEEYELYVKGKFYSLYYSLPNYVLDYVKQTNQYEEIFI